MRARPPLRHSLLVTIATLTACQGTAPPRSDDVVTLVHGYDAARHDATFKTFHHLFAPGTRTPLTKATGGLYPHHRGISAAWNQVEVAGRRLDFWHGRNGESQRYDGPVARSSVGGVTDGAHGARLHWCDRDGNVVVVEERCWRVVAGDEGHTVVDFELRLRAGGAPVALRGDPHHAGFQFRAVADVEATKTTFLRPAVANAEGNDVWSACPWIAGAFAVGGRDYIVAILSAATPANARTSTRAYGRFGPCVPLDLTTDATAVLRYRLVAFDVAATPGAIDRERLEAEWRAYVAAVAGVTADAPR